ncbi:hypothetical protein CJ030_MR2G013113 [Morella rubra]|uniref:Uncharacterized protein n=1 Tax=Morella rubra TaxID=262757 RepID=A0A6A1WAP5_9ROSI|nr:hypothetical protein CJ030_MR2G013110 [Morella rubra]KAB1221389.1 hypothetical protein CJ030_MR2G013113 [Morella rubra]
MGVLILCKCLYTTRNSASPDERYRHQRYTNSSLEPFSHDFWSSSVGRSCHMQTAQPRQSRSSVSQVDAASTLNGIGRMIEQSSVKSPSFSTDGRCCSMAYDIQIVKVCSPFADDVKCVNSTSSFTDDAKLLSLRPNNDSAVDHVLTAVRCG